MFFAVSSLAGAAFGQIAGDYETIAAVPGKHSLAVVEMEEYLNFTCPHCNNFRLASKPLFDKYGTRLRSITRPLLFQGQADPPLRLYFIAERAGRGEEIKEMIFDAAFTYGVNIYDPKVVGFLARSAGLTEQYEKEFDAPWVQRKIAEASARANQAGVEATPTLVLNGSIRLVPRTGMQAFVANLDAIIGQLLK
jgi:hypothetical protein